MFEFAFMRYAFVVAILLAIACSCLGQIMVLKRLSMTGDALSHSSLAGVAFGIVIGINPTLSATIFCVLAAFAIESFRRLFPRYAEIGISVILSSAIGLAAIFASFSKSASKFQSFLFGSLVAINQTELVIVITLTLAVLLVFFLLYKELFFITFDEEGARLSGIPIATLNIVFTLLTAITISVAARTAGALIVSSLMVLPFATSFTLQMSYKKTLIFSIIIGIFNASFGLYLSWIWDFAPGGTIVLLSVVVLILLALSKQIYIFFQQKKGIEIR